MFLVGGVLYDVTDPLHPRRLCAAANTSAHIWTLDSLVYLKAGTPSSTAVILHSISSGNETVPFHIPYPNLQAPGPFATTWWGDGGTVAATTIQPAQPSTSEKSRVWVYTPSFTGEVFSYPYPLTDCICRFGVPTPVLSISPDRQYLVAGWPAGKGAQLSVYRLSDRTLVTTFDPSIGVALWDKKGHRLFLSGDGSAVAWTPESGVVALAGAQKWSFLAGLSPDASQVAYTAYLDNANPMSLRVFVYDMKTNQTRMLRDALRSQVVFVKPGWVWYLEETACDNCAGGTKPTGKVQAMNLADGFERQVDFNYAEETADLVPGEFWPNA